MALCVWSTGHLGQKHTVFRAAFSKNFHSLSVSPRSHLNPGWSVVSRNLKIISLRVILKDSGQKIRGNDTCMSMSMSIDWLWLSNRTLNNLLTGRIRLDVLLSRNTSSSEYTNPTLWLFLGEIQLVWMMMTAWSGATLFNPTLTFNFSLLFYTEVLLHDQEKCNFHRWTVTGT